MYICIYIYIYTEREREREIYRYMRGGGDARSRRLPRGGCPRLRAWRPVVRHPPTLYASHHPGDPRGGNDPPPELVLRKPAFPRVFLSGGVFFPTCTNCMCFPALLRLLRASAPSARPLREICTARRYGSARAHAAPRRRR